VAVGLVLILLYLKAKYRKPKPMTELGPIEPGTVEIDDPELAKYKEQIERDLANLE